ncbi:TolC family protein [Hydrogenovibrio marinus]|uniref:Transporter n=1 Tax=Hydrogenovibrio marinus TaxID=28885 RepID=A0A067A1G6_HYDMR|nr:TolC family protein [Hydrogenovibrio marinus]KDN96466.1 transporter [Hydrogenovibrio marinus]BBN60338.1 hypothetical protein HVMH_1932 [Hydrogenovibrio marinus]
MIMPFKPKKIVLSVSAILASTMLMSFSAQAQEYSFGQCVDLTLTQNPEVGASRYRLQQAESALKESDAHRLPQVTLSATAMNSDDALNVFGMKLSQREAKLSDFGFNNSMQFVSDDLNKPGAHSDFNTRLEVMIPVWNGGRVSSYQEQAKAMIQAAQHGDAAVKQMLTYNVYQAYEGVHTARAFVQVAEQAVKAAQSYVETTKNMVEQGIVVKSELLSANVHLSQAMTALEKAQTQEQIAKDNLRMLMNVDDHSSLTVGPRVDLTVPSNDIQKLLDMANNANPQLEASREVVRSSVAAIDASKADNYPSFNIIARGDTHDKNLGFGAQSYTVAGVVSWKLTDFGLTSSKIDQANALANEKQAALQSKENQTKLMVLKAWRSLQVAEKQRDSNKLAVGQAEEAQRLIMKRYKNGVATMTEVLASQAQLDQSRADLVRSTFEINIQKAQLRLATGTMDMRDLQTKSMVN